MIAKYRRQTSNKVFMSNEAKKRKKRISEDAKASLKNVAKHQDYKF